MRAKEQHFTIIFFFIPYQPVFSSHRKCRKIKQLPHGIANFTRVHCFFDLPECEVEQSCISQDINKFCCISRIIKGIVLSSRKIYSCHVKGHAERNLPVKAKVSIEFFLEV